MQTLNKNLLLLFKNNLDVEQIQNNLSVGINDLFDFFKLDKVLNPHYNKLYDEYYRTTFPIYPTENYKILSSLNAFSSMRIKTIVDDNLDVLKNNLIDNVLTIKRYTDEIPEESELLKISNYLQNIAFNSNYINYDFLNLSQTTFDDSYDLLGSILNTNSIPDYDSSLNSFSSIDLFIFYKSLLKLFVNSTNFYNVIINKLYELDNFTIDLVKNDFNEFISNNHLKIVKDSHLHRLLSTFILKNNFNIFSASSNVQTLFYNFVKSEVYPDLTNAFNTFMDTEILEDFKKSFSIKYINIIRNVIFHNIFQDIISTDITSFFKTNLTRDKRCDNIFSEIYIDEFLNEYHTGSQLKDYLRPVYLYKNSPLKCINTIQAFIKLYFEEKLREHVDFIYQYRYKTDTKVIMKSILSKLNLPYIKSYFESIDILQYFEKNNTGHFISFIFCDDIIQRFCNSETFTNFIITFLEKCNNFLYDQHLITFDHNWYNNIDLIRHYFLIYFLKYNNLKDEKTNTYSNMIFPNIKDNISKLLTDELEFSITDDNIQYSIDSLKNNTQLLDGAHNISKNLLEATIVRKIYFQTLSYFAN